MQNKAILVSLKKSSKEEQLNNINNALKDCLYLLYEKLPLQLWMITKVVGDDWHVLFINNHGTEIKEHDVLCWGDSFCSKMVKGEGPQFTMNANLIEAYKNAPIMKKMPISIYVGVPLNLPDGTFFGTLCGIDSKSDIVGVSGATKTVQAIANIVSTILSTKQKLDNLSVDNKNTNIIDPLTGVNNLEGFNLEINNLLNSGKHNDNSKLIFAISIENLREVNLERGYHIGNIMLSQTAKILCEVTHDRKAVARIDGDKFNVIVKKDSNTIKEIEDALMVAGINNSITKIRDI